jgi:hypothetical protein
LPGGRIEANQDGRAFICIRAYRVGDFFHYQPRCVDYFQIRLVGVGGHGPRWRTSVVPNWLSHGALVFPEKSRFQGFQNREEIKVRKLLLSLLVLGLLAVFAVPAVAQGAEEPPPVVELQPTVGLGGGSFFAEENATFSSDALFAMLHWYAVGLPLADASSGLGLEVRFGGAVTYSVWSLNRAEVPGLGGKVYGVADMKFGTGAPEGYSADFDFRTGLGASLGQVGKGEFLMEFYTLEEDRPIAFSVMYRF